MSDIEDYDFLYVKQVFVSLTISVKRKILEKFGSEIETFIEKEFQPHQTHTLHFFKWKGSKGGDVLALKIPTSEYMLLIRRSFDERRGMPDKYFLCFDIQKREDLELDSENDFLQYQAELYIPENFNRRFHNRGSEKIFKDLMLRQLKLRGH